MFFPKQPDMTIRMNELVLGIDVGRNSVGLAAISLDESGKPVELKNSLVVTHDGGVDPNQNKSAETRLKTSGVARRTRRLYRQRKRRLELLDENIKELGWPIIDLSSQSDPYFPWKVRASLASEKLEGDSLHAALSIAVRHMARHRGWRSPYARVESLFTTVPPSDQFNALKDRVTELTGVIHDEDATPAQVVVETGLDNRTRLRSAPSSKYGPLAVLDGEIVAGQAKEGILGGKLLQSDNAEEIRTIARMQGLSEALTKDLIRWIFTAKSPKGSAERRVKRDALPGQGRFLRAPKAHPEFQRYRIVSSIANLRIEESSSRTKRTLTPTEQQTVVDFLMTVQSSESPTWTTVAELLGIDRQSLKGTASLSSDGERPSARPQVNVTGQRILESKIKPLQQWWKNADLDAQTGLISILSNAGEVKEDDPGVQDALDFISDLDETESEKLHAIQLPAGRAAYSVNSLTRLSDRMLEENIDAHEARKREFGVDDHWTPPADEIGEPVGNPAVDRVTKVVARWLGAVEKEWGIPSSINIEHVRDGFTSISQSREYENEVSRRDKRNRDIVEEAHAQLGIQLKPRSSDITRYLAIRRQGTACAYCGTTISYTDCEMDHIVPRKGPGSDNRRTNLVAVCVRCNRAKSNTPFAVWAETTSIPGVSVEAAVDRVKSWSNDQGLSPLANRNFRQGVIERLQRTVEDEPLDSRSMESIAWMANELRHRIEFHYKKKGADTRVGVFEGRVTSEARKASGLEDRIRLIGGGGKTRLDRRHHAMDAVTIALMRPSVAKTLAERTALRTEQNHTRKETGWRSYNGSDFAARGIYAQWIEHMEAATELLNDALDNNEIPVMRNFRLRLGSSQVHEDTISKLHHKKVGDEWTLSEIDAAATPALWCALTRHSDFDEKDGLTENPARSIRVHDKIFNGSDSVEKFPRVSAAIKVRGGYAMLGNSIHHIRVYRIEGKTPLYSFVRVYVADLLKHKRENLFEVSLPPQSISLRTAPAPLRRALSNSSAQYVGWLVAGDELRFLPNPSSRSFNSGAVSQLLNDFNPISNWQVDGFPSSDKLRLRPSLLAGEGLGQLRDRGIGISLGSQEILEKQGWRVSLNALLKATSVEVIRRTSLGAPREKSNSNLPTSYLLGE